MDSRPATRNESIELDKRTINGFESECKIEKQKRRNAIGVVRVYVLRQEKGWMESKEPIRNRSDCRNGGR
jgi:hypothetical protein